MYLIDEVASQCVINQILGAFRNSQLSANWGLSTRHSVPETRYTKTTSKFAFIGLSMQSIHWEVIRIQLSL